MPSFEPESSNTAFASEPDLICLSHLRWKFVFQRPQHLMSRYARTQRVFFFEEPIFDDVGEPQLSIDTHDGVQVIVPHLPHSTSPEQSRIAQRRVLDEVIASQHISEYVLWYYNPLALAFSAHLRPAVVVYDCMDELSAFKDAPAELPALEAELMRQADVVFTGGQSLYQAKKNLHHNIHALPSSVDVAHFAVARALSDDPPDQRDLVRPRLGFFGVLDERLDIALLAAIADSRPDWQLVMIGPVVKIDADVLPQRENIHYLGPKTYAELPSYIAGWDVALLLFARNAATRFISPTKTPEYLAAGKPVVSTSIADVVTPYGDLQLVRIADNPLAFVRACEHALAERPGPRMARADVFLQSMSWDRTWAKSKVLVTSAARSRESQSLSPPPGPVASQRSSHV
jgi:glycosyltransferase involved in cell wall biosynthesis